MTFKQLLSKYSDQQILKQLFKLYPKERKSLNGYVLALNELRKKRPVKSNMVIVIKQEKDEEKQYANVSGKAIVPEDNYDGLYAVGLMHWGEWVASDIDEQTLKRYSELDILCHCLWEMTFYGYSNKSIQYELHKLDKISQDIKTLK